MDLTLGGPLLSYAIGQNEKDITSQEGFGNLGLSASTLYGFLVALLSAFLAYHKNANESTLMRWLYTIVAFIFGGTYLAYYMLRYNALPILKGNNINGGFAPVTMPL